MKSFDPGQLRLARRNAKLTLKDAAKLLFLSVSCLTEKENGRVRVFADELNAFAKLYNIDIETFFIEKFDGMCK